MTATLLALALASMGASGEQSLRQGIAAFGNGHYEQAIELFTSSLADDSLSEETRASVLYNRGIAWRQQGDLSRAFADLDGATQLEPSSATYMAGRAEIRAARGEIDLALADYRTAMELDPSDAFLLYSRAGLLERLGRKGRALEDYRAAVEIQPNLQAAHIQIGRLLADRGEIVEALASLDRAVALERNAIALNNRAAVYMRAGDLDRADADLEAILAVDPDDAGAWLNLGLCQAARGEHDQAIEMFDRAIELQPTWPDPYVNRGISWSAKNQGDRALADLDTALELEPDRVGALSSRATLLESRGDSARATADWTRLLRIDPDNVDAYWKRGSARFDAGDFDGAAADFGELSRRQPRDPYGYLWKYIATARGHGDLDQALQDLDRLPPDPASWPMKLVDVFRGEIPPADCVKAALASGEDHLCQAQFFTGEFFLIHGEPEQARISLEESAAVCGPASREQVAAGVDLQRLDAP